jgi:6-phosphogluconate dehydrogenase
VSEIGIAVVGTGDWGANLVRNFARHRLISDVHNRSAARTAALIADHGTEGRFVPTTTAAEFVAEANKKGMGTSR